MVRNLRPGDKWVPGTIIERTGLLYVVQVAEGQTWKHHVDHLRQMEDSLQQEQMTDEGVTDSDVLIRFPPSETSTSSYRISK